MNSSDSTPRVPLDELRDGPSEPEWRRIEATLLAAFAARAALAAPLVSADSHPGKAGASWIEHAARWRWLASAAGIVLAAAITFAPVPKRDRALPTPPPPTPGPSAPPSPSPQPRQLSAPAVKPPSVPTPRRAASQQSASRRPRPASSGFDGFVVLPSAFALPDFESGRIVRVEVPITVLPAYGIDLVPDASPAAVQADFLIGQDGVPRAIRLASYSPH